MTPLPLQSKIRDATEFIRTAWNKSPQFGIILGTGAGQLADEIQQEEVIPYKDVPHFPLSTALSHASEFVCGRIANKEVLAMAGRFHLYEGYQVDDATLPIHVMHQLGVKMIFISNAAGGVNPQMASGEVMLIDSHIDFMNRSNPNMTSATFHGARPALRSDAYDRELIQQAQACARAQGFPVHLGVYAAMLGPNFETRAEYRMLRRLGADTAGMSTVPEVAVASKYGMRIMGLSVITNIANPDNLKKTTGEDVVAAAEKAAPDLKALVVNAITKADFY